MQQRVSRRLRRVVELNQATIDAALEEKKSEIQKDLEKELHDRLKKDLRRNKNIIIK